MESLLAQVNDWKDLIPLMAGLIFAHRQAMKKLDAVIESSHEIKETLVEHNVKLGNGESRMDKIEEDVDLIRSRQHEISNEVHKMKGRILTPEHVKLMINSGK